MLREIFTKIASETESFLLVKGLATRVRVGEPAVNSSMQPMVYIAMQQYGIDPILKNRPPVIDDDMSSTPNYSHLISFYISPVCDDYEMKLQLIEAVVEHFEIRPFFQLVINHDEFELSISMKNVSAADYDQFWLARQQPSQPVVFYQARVSAL
jgi:hypothetical protein